MEKFPQVHVMLCDLLGILRIHLAVLFVHLKVGADGDHSREEISPQQTDETRQQQQASPHDMRLLEHGRWTVNDRIRKNTLRPISLGIGNIFHPRDHQGKHGKVHRRQQATGVLKIGQKRKGSLP